jgi:hypothetical protein
MGIWRNPKLLAKERTPAPKPKLVRITGPPQHMAPLPAAIIPMIPVVLALSMSISNY